MADGPPGASELDAYREEADRFLAELHEETYRHYAGLKDELELAPIYERHESLTALETCRELEGRVDRAGGRGPATELWRFACEGRLGRSSSELDERIAGLEAGLAAAVDGERVGYRSLPSRLANEPERRRRALLEQARRGLVAQLEEHHVEALERARETARALGAATYRELYERFGVPLEQLARASAGFLAETDELHAELLGRLTRSRLGLEPHETGRGDVPRLFRAPAWDDGFPAGRMVAALEATLADLGVDLRAQRNVELDLEPRPTKAPRAFCSPIEVPGRVVLVVDPIGGLDDWRALFHEAGHAEHFAHVSPRLAFEARRLGDDAVTETWAFLLEHLVTTPAWLARRLDLGRPRELARESGAVLLYLVRRTCAKLLYELELHGGAPLGAMPALYAERLTVATGIEHPEVDYLADVDAGFYAASYLRAWALEAQLAAALEERFGSSWFADRRAGSLLRELWSEGQGLDADAIAREVTGAPLELAPLVERIREATG